MEENLKRLERLVRLSLGANAVMIVLNGALFYGLVVFVVNEPAEVEGVVPTEVKHPDDVDPRAELRDFFKRTSDLIDRTARKNGANPGEFLPTQEDIDQAVETRTIHSDESQAVLQKLREGYDFFDLTWPKVMPQR